VTRSRRRPAGWLTLLFANLLATVSFATASFATLSFATLSFASAALADEPAPAPSEPGANLDVAVYTFGAGEEVWERFGHNAIEIRDRSSGHAILYNYGIFDFAQENFFLNFARGLMTYRIAADDPAEELPNYVAQGRWIVRQTLAFTPAQRAKLADFLAWNVREENAQYRYDYFRANCSTRVRDALDQALDGAIKAQTVAPSRGFTYRMDADRLLRPDMAIMLLVDAGLGPFADQRLSYWDESFVPMEFMRHLREIRIRDAAGNTIPLVASETELARARIADPPEFPVRWTWQALALGIAFALCLVALARARTRAAARMLLATAGLALCGALGVAGLVLAALWALTDHVSAWRNENLLLLDPLCLLLLPAWFGALRLRWQPSRFAARIALVIAGLAAAAWFVKILPGFRQDNAFWIALLLPIHIASALVLGRASRKHIMN
jgi:uncharacterized protein DUF4105